IVGLCDEELRLVQRWTGGQVADILRQEGATGGRLLVTDLHREQSIFELEPGLADYINERMRREGSNLSGVTTQFFAWAAIDPHQLAEPLPGESEASVAAAANQHNRAVAMETEDSGSVTTLHKAPSSVATHIPLGSKSDDAMVDIVKDGSASSSDTPRTKNAKNENSAATDTCDSEMRVVESEDQKHQENKEHGNSAHEKKEEPTAFRNGSSILTSASPLDILTEMRLRRAGGASSAGSFIPGRFGGGSSSLPGTPGSSIGGGGDSAPCTPLAHLSLSPASLEMHPSRAIDCLDVHLSLEAGKLLPLAICDRLKHGRHFTFLNANYPEHAITLVPPGVTGAMVTPDVPFVSRGSWLQIFLPKDFLEQLERQFSILQYPDEVILPLVFRWPERRFRVCILDATNTQLAPQPTIPPPVPQGHPIMSPRSMPGSAAVFTPTSPMPPYLFPPGCVPPPQVLAAFINAQQGRGGFMGSASPQGSGASSSQSPPFMPPPCPLGKPSPASAPHLPFSQPVQAPPTISPNIMEAMLASFMSLYGNKTGFGGGGGGGNGGVPPFVPPFTAHQHQPEPPSDPSNTRPSW
ncbi:unnamed protein product, partial [Hymenolepis diminuta]